MPGMPRSWAMRSTSSTTTVAGDRRKPMELDQGLTAVLAWGERDGLAAVDVEVLRSRGQILQESESRFPARTCHLHAHAVAAAHLERWRADNEDRETVAARG